jgi:hypothetical protein
VDTVNIRILQPAWEEMMCCVKDLSLLPTCHSVTVISAGQRRVYQVISSSRFVGCGTSTFCLGASVEHGPGQRCYLAARQELS